MQPGWSLQPSALTLLPPHVAHALFAPASLPLHLPAHAQRRAAAAVPGVPAAAAVHQQQQGEGQVVPQLEEAPCALGLFEALVLEGADGAAAHEEPPAGTSGREVAAGGAGRDPPRKRARKQAGEVGSAGGEGAEGGRAGASSAGARQQAAADVVMFTGGLVWSAAFCPHTVPLQQQLQQLLQQQQQPPPQVTPPEPQRRRQRGPAHHSQQQRQQQQQQQQQQPPAGAPSAAGVQPRDDEVLAVAVHPAGVTRTRQGAVQEGQGAVQIWHIPGTASMPTSGSSDAAPRLACCLVHQGRVTWDLQWCPEPHRVLSAASWQGGAGLAAVPNGSTHAAGQASVGVAGVLAMVLGDGGVQAVCVPHLSHLHMLQQQQQQQQQQQSAQGAASAQVASGGSRGSEGGGAGGGGACSASARGTAAPLCLSIAPHVHITREQLGGAAASSVAWRHGSQPGLLVGCWDGSMCVWALPSTAARPLQRLCLLFAARPDPQPVRRVAWHPLNAHAAMQHARGSVGPHAPASSSGCGAPGAAGASGSGSGAEQGGVAVTGAQAAAAEVAEGVAGCATSSLDDLADFMCMSVGQGGVVRLWDIRDPVCPVLPRLVHRTALYDAAWAAGPPPNRCSLHFAMDDGILRQMELEPQHYVRDAANTVISMSAGYDPSCTWSLSYSPITACLAFGGDDGIVALSTVEACSEVRARQPHVPIGGMVSDGGALRVVGPRQLAGVPCVFGGGRHFKSTLGVGGSKVTGAGRRGLAGVASLRDSTQTLHTVRWSPNAVPVADHSGQQGATRAAWLAYGGAAGLVRCQRVAAQM